MLSPCDECQGVFTEKLTQADANGGSKSLHEFGVPDVADAGQMVRRAKSPCKTGSVHANQVSRNMHSFIDVLVATAEKPDADGQSLTARLRDSFDRKWGTYDGVVRKIPSQEVKAAYNVLADWLGVDLLGEGEELSGPNSDMFVEVVLYSIKEKRA